jgi:hypothetical protein
MYQELKHTVQHKHDLSLSSPAYPISKRIKRYETCVCLRVSASALSRTKIEGKYSKSDVFASLPLFAKQHHSTIHVGFEVLYGKLHVVLPFPKYENNNGMSSRRALLGNMRKLSRRHEMARLALSLGLPIYESSLLPPSLLLSNTTSFLKT